MINVLIVGSEASGNTLVHRIIHTAGDVEVASLPGGRWDQVIWRVSLPGGEMMLTTSRSLPHGEEWPDIGALIGEFDPDKIVLTWRDRDYQTRSAFAAEHTRFLREAVEERERADELLAQINGPVFIMVYELLVLDPATQIRNLSGYLGVPLRLTEKIYDGNAKWRET